MQLRVNNQVLTVHAAPETPLLWVLREELTLVGSKFGCGMGLCGACTVLIDGKATRSCITPISTLQGKSVTTIEGLSLESSILTDCTQCRRRGTKLMCRSADIARRGRY